MVSEDVESGITILELAKSPFVDDAGVSRIVEDTGGDPWLENKMR